MTGRNIALRLRYDGTAYHGWQVQKNAATVCETLERALTRLCGHEVRVVGCGRTDAGSHALRQLLRTFIPHRLHTYPRRRFPPAANTYLPEDVCVVDAVEAPTASTPSSPVTR